MTVPAADRSLPTLPPALREDVEFIDRGHWALASVPGGPVLRVSPAELAWLRAARRPDDWAPGGPAPMPPHVDDLLDALRDAGFCDVPASSAPRGGVRVTMQGVEFAGPQPWLVALYRRGLDRLFTRRVAISAACVASLGAVALAGLLGAGHPLVPAEFDPVVAGLILIALELFATIVHETAHALALIHGGRNVRGVGFGFYWGALSFYVDSTEALLLPRRGRLLQSAAGPIADVVLAGAASLCALVVDGPASAVLLTYAVFAWLDVLVNLVPFLELDGYWIMADCLDRPFLRDEATEATREVLATGSTRRPGLAIYGIASFAVGLTLLGAGLFAWWQVVGDLLAVLIGEGPVGWLVALALAAPTLVAWLSLIAQLVVFLSRRPRPVG